MKRLIFFLATGIFSLSAADFSLLKNGKPQAVIAAPESATKTVDFFNAEFKKSSGTELKKVTEAPKDGNVIEIKIVPSKYLERSRFMITFPAENRMRIEGTETSVRFALNHILEQMGVRYPFPGPFGGHYPKITDFSLPEKTVTKDAGFRLFRGMYAENKDWELALNNIPQDSYELVNHGIAELFPIQEYGQEKWKDSIWGLIDGKRKKPIAFVWEPCYTSKVTEDEAVKRICDILEKNPERHTIALTHNDGLNQFCNCENCAKLDSKESDVAGKLKKYPMNLRKYRSESYYTWVNNVVKRVLEKYPDTYFGVSAYTETLLPPSFRLNDHVMVNVCTESYAHTDPAVRGFWEELIREWNRKAAMTGCWEYGYGVSQFTLPRVYFKETDRFIKFLAANKGEVCFTEGFPSFGEGPKRYLYLRYFYNPQLDVKAELDDWYRACVGKEAAPYLKQYYDFWDDFWRNKATKTAWFNESKFSTYTALVPDGGYLFALEKGDMAKLRSLMEKVVSTADRYGDENQKKRAAALMKEFEFYEAAAYMNAAEWIGIHGLTDKRSAMEVANAIPKILEYAQKRPAIAKVILNTFPKETWGGYYPYMRKNYEEKYTKTVFPEILSELSAWLDDPEVRKAYESKTAAANVPESWKKTMKFLLDLNAGTIPNLVPDPSFETGRGKWIAMGNVSPKYAKSGKQSFEFIMPRSEKGEMVLRIPMKAHKKYFLSAKVYLDAEYPPDRAFAYGFILGINKLNVGSNYYIPIKTKLVPGKWNSISTTAAVGDADGKGDIYLVFLGMEKGEKVYVDDVVFVEFDSGEESSAAAVKPIEENSFSGWVISDMALRKESAQHVKAEADKVTLTAKEKSFIYFSAKAVPVKNGDKVKISFRVSGKGSAGFGFFAYAGTGWKQVDGNVIQTLPLKNESETVSVVLPVNGNEIGSVRPVFTLGKESEMTVSNYKLTLEK